ncbi:MAG: cell division protein ZapE, partial [Hyphomicrobiales bacterium]
MSSALLQTYRALTGSGELTADADQDRVIGALDQLCQQLDAYEASRQRRSLTSLFSSRAETPKGAYLYGGVGRGKTMLMDLFHDAAPVAAKRRVHFHEFMQEVHGQVHDRRQAHSKGYVKAGDPIPPVADDIARTSRLICFDEFQVTDITDAMILGRLFTALFKRGVIVVATSNRHPDTLYEGGLNRGLFLPFIGMLKDKMEVIALDGETDYRLRCLDGMPVYYTPLGAATDAQIQTAWTRLTNVERGTPASLEVKGRTIPVPQAAKGVARFSFADLCEQPLGAADFLKVARNFHTVFLERIPALGPEKRNEARRFVNLIDSLYYNK